jgi:Tol biopolymer transport system component
MIVRNANARAGADARRAHVAPAILISWLACFAGAPAAIAQDAQWAIYVMRADGGEVRKLAQVEGCGDHSSPRWSHDGKRVAFDARRLAINNRVLFIVNADGSELRQLSDDSRPDWSPDDKQIASDQFSGGTRAVFVQNLDGQGRVQVAERNGPRWSPDGGSLAVTDHHDLFVIDVVSGEERALFDVAYPECFHGFAWSPDGRQLAVVIRPERGKPRQLLLVDAAGAARSARLRLQGEMGGYLSFSPDAKQLVYSDEWMLRVIDVKGTGKPRLLPGQKGRNRHPHWSPDGKSIVFCSDRSEQ